MDQLKKKVVYISGKMTGEPDLGRKKFAEAAESLTAQGYIVMSPAMLPTGMDGEKYMPICMAMIDQCDEICMMQDWVESRGARLERDYAKYNGKTVRYLNRKETIK